MMEEDKNSDEKLVSFLTGESNRIPEADGQEGKSFSELEKTWDLTGTAYSYRNCDPDLAWSKINEKLTANPKVPVVRRFSILRVAAVFAALVTLSSIAYFLTRNSAIDTHQLVAARVEIKSITTVSNPAEPTTVLLPDGSTVKMNASSTLEYPAQFAAGSRKVKLSGEAYFEVIHDASNPFVVEVNQVEVEDLGTSFNISAYPGKKLVEVNVSSGSVRLREKNYKEEAVLPAGWNGKCMTENGKIESSNKLPANYLSWITKEVSFHHTPLSMVFEELENIYHVRIEYADPQIANIPYTANFAKFELGDILNIIARTNHLSLSKEGEGFVLAPR